MRRSIAIGIGTLLVVADALGVEYKYVELFKLQPPVGSTSLGVGKFNGTIAPGNWRGPSSNNQPRATVWNLPDGAPTIIHPPGFRSSTAIVSDGTLIGGGGEAPLPLHPPDPQLYAAHALLWTSLNSSPIDLNPVGFYSSTISSVKGNQQVGIGNLVAGGRDHAMLRKGTAASAIDLHPATFVSSDARATDDVQQVGAGYDDSGIHALLWSGTAASVIDLLPTGYTTSYAQGVGFGQQVGMVFGPSTNGNDHAMLWNGTAASAIDLHPAGRAGSRAYATNGMQQVGSATTIVGSDIIVQAAIWSGTAGSFVNLGDLLPPDSYSEASGIDLAGNVFGVRYRTTSFLERYAVMWSPVPEPSTFALLAIGGILLHRVRRRLN